MREVDHTWFVMIRFTTALPVSGSVHPLSNFALPS